MLEAGKKFRHLVQFLSGQPTSNLTYTLYNQNGGTVLTQTVPILSGQLSYTIEIAGGSNTMIKPLFEKMTLEWQYNTASAAILDSISYTLHAPIGFPVSAEGVRDLLGVSKEEVPDSDVKLFEGYLAFRELAGETTNLAQYQDNGDFNTYRVSKAIEAATALAIFPTLQIRLPKKYDSGTSSYERWNTIDWDALQAEITNLLGIGLELVNFEAELYPTIDIFVLSDVGPDAITGE